MEQICDNCGAVLNTENESAQYPGICVDCIEKEPLIVNDENFNVS
jgi:hypothetical protein